MSSTYIRTSSHGLRFANTGKRSVIAAFVSEYRKAVLHYVAHIWDARYEWVDTVSQKQPDGSYVKTKVTKYWDRLADQLDCPEYVSTVGVETEDTLLTARALKCAVNQASGIVRALSEKRKKDQDEYEFRVKNNKKIKKELTDRLEKGMTFPECNSINCEVNSLCIKMGNRNTKNFDLWLNFASMFKACRGQKVAVPVKHNRKSRQWAGQGELCGSFLLNEHHIQLRWRVQAPEKKKEGRVVAGDSGINSCLTTSDDFEFPRDKHGHDLNWILGKLAGKRWGSKAFKRVTRHRKNYINWFIKQVKLDDVKTFRLEKISNLFYKKKVCRKVKGFTNTLIENALKMRCEEAGVQLIMVASAYNSQRCAECGWTQESNRSGKRFLCKKCGHRDDADHNASLNIHMRDELVELPDGFTFLKRNVEGFYWLETGLFLDSGEEIAVPLATEN